MNKIPENIPNNSSRVISVKRNTILFGSYPQGPNGELAPIEWRVIDSCLNSALLVSKYALDVRRFDIPGDGEQKGDKQSGGKRRGRKSSGNKTVEEVPFDGNLMWGFSDMRRWLNREFLKIAFTEEERRVISFYSTENPYDIEIEDEAFVPSLSEAEEYSLGKCMATDYVAAMGKDCVAEDKSCRWWLRSHSKHADPYTAVTVNHDGKIEYSGADIGSVELAVRPAIVVNFEKFNPPAFPDSPGFETDVSKTARESVIFGSYPFGKDCEQAPIEWEILEREGDTALVISKHGLDARLYNQEGCEWKDSDMRDWLNNWFIMDAFTPEERGKILESRVKTDGVETADKVFFLDADEAGKYFSSDADRMCELTDYAIACGGYHRHGRNDGCWWLRNKGEKNAAAIVEEDGSVDEAGTAVRVLDVAVRPVMRISLRKDENDSGEETRTDSDCLTPEKEVISGKSRDTTFFGTYPQDEKGGLAPIEWIILENDGEKALLVTRFAIDAMEFDFDPAYHTLFKGCPNERRWWEKSALRAWLHGAFLEHAFSDEERKRIVQVPFAASSDAGGGVNCEALDSVFLLSKKDAEKYFGSRYDMACIPTGYAKKEGAGPWKCYKVKGEPVCAWWMAGNNGAGNALFRFSKYDYAGCADWYVGVRPAMWVTADALGGKAPDAVGN